MSEFLEYARRGRTEWWRWLATLAMAIVLALLASLTRDLLIVQPHMELQAFEALTKDPTHPAWFFGNATVTSVILLLSLAATALVIQNKSFLDIVGAWRWRRAALGAGAGLIFCLISTGADYLVHPDGFQLILGPETATLLLVAIPFSLLGALSDEFVFRGYLAQGLLLAAKRPLVAAAAVGVFGCLGARDWPHAAGDFAGGVATALIAIRTGGVAFTWGLGVGATLFNAVAVVSSEDVFHGAPGIFSQTTPDLAWFDVAVNSLLLAALVLWIMRRYPASDPVGDPTSDVFA